MTKNQPPAFYRALLKWFCKNSLVDELTGDLEESFQFNIESKGIRYARKKYRHEVMHLIRPSVVKKLKVLNMGSNYLFTHYTKIAVRNLRNNWTHTGISLVGLTLAITTSALIFQFNYYEEQYDNFHVNAGEIYRLQNNVSSITTGEVLTRRASTFYAAHPLVMEEIPEVINSTHLHEGNGVISYEQNSFNLDQVLYATTSFFEMFTFPLVSGNIEDLDKPGMAFVSESEAKRLFKDANPIGKTVDYYGIRTGGTYRLEIRGVYEDIPPNSYFQAQLIIPMAEFRAYHDRNDSFAPLTVHDIRWRWTEFYTFVQIDEDADYNTVQDKVTTFYQKYRKALDENQGREQRVNLQPLKDIHLTPGLFAELNPTGDRQMVRFFYLIAILILVIAWINYVNMATAVAVNRAREVGVRKVLGAVRRQLIFQFLFESLLLNLIAIVISVLLLLVIIPFYHSFLEKDVFALFWEMKAFWSVIGMSIILGALIAGFYPAIVLSAFKPSQVLRVSIKYAAHGILLRKGLVVFQFMIAVFLLSGAIAIHSQLDYMINHDPGFEINQNVLIEAPPFAFRDSTYNSRMNSFMDIASQRSEVQSVTNSSIVPGILNRWRMTGELLNNPDQETVFLSRMSVDPNYISTYQFTILAGRGFSESMRADAGASAVVNLSAVRMLGFSDPEEILGEQIRFSPEEIFKVVGVLDDFYQNGMQSAVAPMVMHIDPDPSGGFVTLTVDGSIKPLMASLEKTYNEFFPRTPFNFHFLDDSYKAQYEEDQRFQQIFNFFTFIAIFIACLGLLGLSAFFVMQKRKEVSIRKVLGASRSSILTLVLREYWQLILLAAVLSIPLAYIGVNDWLDNYAFRAELSIWIFILPVVGLGLIVFTTISQNTFSLVNSNPVNNLKND